MICQKTNSGKLFFVIFISCFIYLSPVYSQTDFGLNSGWEWEDLIDKAVMVNPYLIKTVSELKEDITIEDARFLLKNLILLDTLQELSGLYIIGNESDAGRLNRNDSLIKSVFDSTETSGLYGLDGILTSMSRLSGIRKVLLKENKFDFKNRTYLPQPVSDLNTKSEIKFNYTVAENILEYYRGDTDFRMHAVNSGNFNSGTPLLYKGKLSEDGIVNILEKSSSEDPLNLIYSWINPGSLYNFRGVHIYRDNFSSVINTIKENEKNIRFDIEKNILKYLPDNTSFSAGITFLFCESQFVRRQNKSNVYVSLEYFGDDYNYLVSYVTHEIYIKAEKEIQLSAVKYFADESVPGFTELITNIEENGIANYVAPVGSETRPWNLLEKDFQLFNNTYKQLRKNSSKKSTDSLLAAGYSGNAPFYTMGTQMAYIIETTLGRKSLIKSISLGPVSFFSNFIKAYNEYPDKIRRVFTFSKGVEKEIARLSKKFPENIQIEALKLKNYTYDKDTLNRQVVMFINKYSTKSNQALMCFLSGKILLDAGDYGQAENYFIKFLELKKQKGNSPAEIGILFSERNADNEAIKFFSMYAEENPGNAKVYELRGESYFKTGEMEKSGADFRKALSIDPSSEISKEYLGIMK